MPSRMLTVLTIVLLLSGCAGARPEIAPPSAPTGAVADDGLNATLWVQTAAEYEAAALQAYVQAEIMLERALADRSWSAALEQLSAGGYAELPPAVILDVDETVLDNSAYQARLIAEGTLYESATWNEWVREQAATPVPGALAFTRAAAARGVAVFYVTNRVHEVEEATRANLVRFGFPMTEREDRLLTRGEKPEWDGEKVARRRHVGERYRILLLVGDNFGDFAPGVEADVATRARLAADWKEFWGRRWIVLPNPQYGSWEGALFGYDFGLTPEQRRARKRAELEQARR